jgi:hypothetical protein
MEQKTGVSTGGARRIGGIQDVAYGLTSTVGCQRWNRDESFHVNGVEVSIMGHDRPRWRFRISTLMLLVIILALALTLVIDRWKREQELRRLAAEEQRAVAEARARAQSQRPP